MDGDVLLEIVPASEEYEDLVDHVVDLFADTDLSAEEFSAALDEAKARVRELAQ